MSKIQRPAKVSYDDISKIKMAAGNEKRFTRIIKSGTILEWVGIGWIKDGPATEKDYEQIPELDECNGK